MPNIEERFLAKLESLIKIHGQLGRNRNQVGQLSTAEERAACAGWMTSALATVEGICPEGNGYRQTIQKLAGEARGLLLYENVVHISSILEQLVEDAKSGLLVTLGDTARAETFVEFLDHGKAYLQEKRKMESGVIIGVVFEDTVRRICEKNGIPQAGRKLDDLISELQKAGKLTPVQAKRARVGADVRTKATHAQWEQFELGDTEEALKFTESLIEQHLS